MFTICGYQVFIWISCNFMIRITQGQTMDRLKWMWHPTKDSKSDSESSQTWVHIFGDKMMYGWLLRLSFNQSVLNYCHVHSITVHGKDSGLVWKCATVLDIFFPYSNSNLPYLFSIWQWIRWKKSHFNCKWAIHNISLKVKVGPWVVREQPACTWCYLH